jgi:hypothetical protein
MLTVDRYTIKMDSLWVPNNSDGITTSSTGLGASEPLYMTIDSGTTGLALTKNLREDVAKQLNGEDWDGWLAVQCDFVDANPTIDFHITKDTIISVPLKELIATRQGTWCMLAITSEDHLADGACKYFCSKTSSLPWRNQVDLAPAMSVGTQFLSHSFVVFDPDHCSVSIARGADCGSNIVAIDGVLPANIRGSCEEKPPKTDSPAPIRNGRPRQKEAPQTSGSR